jgi:dTDP-4-dehydrorhamnose reductase
VAAGRRDRPLVVVTGASGYLGTHLVPQLAERADVLAVSRTAPAARRLDLTDADAVVAALGSWRPDAVVHAAAANPGSPGAAMEPVNVGGSRAVARGVAALGGACRLVHVSTDVVHDGRAAPYADDAAATPLGDYGRSKAAAEDVVLGLVPSAVVVRTSLIYGLERVDRGTEGFLDRLRRGETLRLFSDVVRQPVWVDSLAAALVRLALDQPDVAGRLNVAGSQPVTRAVFGRRMLDWWGATPPAAQLEELSAAGLPDVPLDLRLRLDRAGSLGLPTPGLDEVMAGGGGRHPGQPTAG